jgi:hypothetical protein
MRTRAVRFPPVPAEPSLPVLACQRIETPFRVDGDVHKPPWTAIEPVWLAPADGSAAAVPSVEIAKRHLAEDASPLPARFSWQPTALRTCRDEARLYVAFQCVDRDAWGTHEGRNAPIYEEEVVEAFLAPGPTPRRYFELESSPRGAWFEARIDSPEGRRATMHVDRDWVCAGWERAVRVRGRLERHDGDDAWWSVEWAIPFASLGVEPPPAGERWRANFFRIDREGGGQYSAWSPTFARPPDFHVPDRFGVLAFP